MKNKESYERKVVMLFIAAVLIIVGWVLLKDPKIIGYATAENRIEIINKQSYSNVGEDWIIRFLTQGEGDLEISEIKGSFYDVSPLEIRCGDEILNYEMKGSEIRVKDYRCDGVGEITTRIGKEGIQTLKLKFGNKIYASNIAQKENI